MAVTHKDNPTRDAMANAVCSLVNAGSALPNGRLQLAVDSAFTDIVVAIDLLNPAFSTASAGSGTCSVNGTPLSAVYGGATTKTIAYFRFVNRDGGEVFRGTVSAAAGSGDLRLADNVIPPGTTVTIVSFVYATIP